MWCVRPIPLKVPLPSATNPSFDAIVIGAGHNGLIAAAYLGRAGRRVLVVEKRELIGGCCVTEETWPGFRVNTAAYLVSLLQPQIIEDLELARHGYAVLPKDPAFFSPFPDGRCLFMWQDAARTLAEVAKFSARDAQAFPKYEHNLERIAGAFASTLMKPPPADIMAALAPKLTVEELKSFEKLLTWSVMDFLDEWFESPEIKVTLATDGFIGANGGPRSPGTAYILLHHMMGMVGGKRGLWGFVQGGMGAIPNAIAASARSYGAEIRVNASVSRILIRNDEAYGVVLESGDEIAAPLVISDLDPPTTYLKLVEKSILPDEFTARIARYRTEGTSMKINLGLNGVPEFRSLPGGAGPQHRATIHICPSIEYVEAAWTDAHEGRPSRNPLLEMTIPTMYDPGLAPRGHHIMGVFLQYAPYTLRDGNWDDLRETVTERVLDLIEEEIPNLRQILVHRQALTPVDLERKFGITGGNIFHGELALDQMFAARPGYRSPIQSLFLCGSGTHPGGGVMGACGYNCAREILG